MANRAVRKLNPEILVFDVDGVLIDVRETFWRSALAGSTCCVWSCAVRSGKLRSAWPSAFPWLSPADGC